jgi:hypothetical protein
VNDDFGLPCDPQNGAEHTPGSRQAERQGGIPALYKTTHERLAVELAMRMEPPEDIFPRYGYNVAGAAELMESPAFTVLLGKIGTEIRENGLSFRMKAKAISEELLPHALDMATDPLCSSAVRADLIKWAAKVAGNEPAPAKVGVGEGAGGFSLSITFAGQAPQQVLTEGRTLEHAQ